MIPRLVLTALLVISAASQAEERVELEGSTIIGNSELPKVLYIAPWRRSRPGRPVDPTLTSDLLEEPLRPVDPEEFRRDVEYWQWLEGEQRRASR